MSEFDKSAKCDECNIEYSNDVIAVCNDDSTDVPKVLPLILVLKNGLTYKKRDLANILTFPLFEDGSEEQMYCDLTLFRPHKKNEFQNLNYQEVLALYQSKDINPEINGRGNTMTKERAK